MSHRYSQIERTKPQYNMNFKASLSLSSDQLHTINKT